MRGMLAALNGDEIDRQAYIDRETLLAGVVRKIVSDTGGAVLDISTAVMVQVHLPNEAVVVTVVTGDEYDQMVALGNIETVREKYAATKIEVIDGRWYTKAGKLRADERKRREQVVVTAMTEITQDLDAEFGTPEQ